VREDLPIVEVRVRPTASCQPAANDWAHDTRGWVREGVSEGDRTFKLRFHRDARVWALCQVPRSGLLRSLLTDRERPY
jgi:hypothetical protein